VVGQLLKEEPFLKLGFFRNKGIHSKDRLIPERKAILTFFPYLIKRNIIEE
jgi:hypothetical protein